MDIHTLLLYLVVAFFCITSPGPAIILAIINGLRTNMKTVAITSLANSLGLFILSTAAILGLGIIITTSATLFIIIKSIGALYLIYLGIKFLRNRGGFNIDKNKDRANLINKIIGGIFIFMGITLLRLKKSFLIILTII